MTSLSTRAGAVPSANENSTGNDSVDTPRVMVIGSGWRFTSGISYYTCRLANALAEVTPTTALLIRQLMPTLLYPGRNRVGVEVNALTYAPVVRVFDGLDWFWGPSMIQARRFLETERPDVVVLQWWTGAVLHSYLRLARLVKDRGGRVIMEWHESQDTGEARIPGLTKYVDSAMKRLLRMVDGHVVHSKYDLELLRARYDLGDRPTVLAPHGPYDHHKPSGAAVTAPDQSDTDRGSEKEFVFLYFGVIRPYKGVEDLVAAFELLPPEILEQSRLVLVGETWEGWTAPLEAVARSPHRDRIEVVNRYVSDAEVSEHFARADAVVLPYRRSSSSGPLHIAMSAGLPVVVTAVGGLVEAAESYTGATFVPPADPDALAEAMAELPAAEPLRHADPHSWDRTVSTYRDVLAAIGAPVWAGVSNRGEASGSESVANARRSRAVPAASR